MSKAYDEYLITHIENVTRAFNYLKPYLKIYHGITKRSYDELCKQISLHDRSKYSPIEYKAYDDYFYEKKDDKNLLPEIEANFDLAWNHHIHNNPHHWQYWLLIDENPMTLKPLEMPFNYVVEMICDWMSFGIKAGNPKEILDFYDKQKDNIILHENTRKEVEAILNYIFNIDFNNRIYDCSL